jgi:hypothetical protein
MTWWPLFEHMRKFLYSVSYRELTLYHRQLVQEAGIVVMDNEENIVRLGTIRCLSKYGFTTVPGYAMPELTLPFGSLVQDSNKPPARTKIPRPRNAFIIYRMSKRLEVRAANPNVHNNQICKWI